jgi:hypothetical protein
MDSGLALDQCPVQTMFNMIQKGICRPDLSGHKEGITLNSHCRGSRKTKLEQGEEFRLRKRHNMVFTQTIDNYIGMQLLKAKKTEFSVLIPLLRIDNYGSHDQYYT